MDHTPPPASILELDESWFLRDELPGIGEEKMLYGLFERKYVANRKSFIPQRIVPFSGLQLPNGSVLHTTSNFLTPKATHITPDLSNPLVANEQFMVYVKPWTEMAAATDGKFPVTDTLRYVPGRLVGQINNFYQHMKGVRKVTSVDTVLARDNVLFNIDYNPLLTSVVTGTLQEYRRFDAWLRSVLRVVDSIGPAKWQFLHVPVSPHVYSRMQFMRAFQKLDRSTLRIRDDQSYFFLIHLLGYLADAPTSLFPKLDRGTLDSTHVVFTIADKAIVYNLGVLKDVADNPMYWNNVLRHINLMKLAATKNLSVDTLPADDEGIDKHLETLARKDDAEGDAEPADKAGGATPLTEGEVTARADAVKAAVSDFSKTVVIIKGNPQVIAQHQVEAERFYGEIAAHVRDLGYLPQFDAGEDFTQPPQCALWIGHSRGADRLRFARGATKTLAFGSPLSGAINHPDDRPVKGGPVSKHHFVFTDAMRAAITKALTGKAPITAPVAPPVPALPPPTPTAPLREHLVTAAKAHLAAHPALSDAQRKRGETLLDRHLATTLGGAPLGEHLAVTTLPPIDAKRLTHLEKALPDASMARSSVIDYDRLYVQEVLTRDVAQVVSSFLPHGVYVANVEERDEIDQLNRTRHTKVTLVDAAGKQHTVRFKMPIVSRDGTFLANGIEQRMVKQMVNLPICKVSPTRVNLATNYNKTLVERSVAKAANFETYITRYINELRKAGKLTVKYGRLEVGQRRLPFDYTAVAAVYARLQFGSTVLVFDYDRYGLQGQAVADGRVPEGVAIRAAQESDAAGIETLLFAATPDRTAEMDAVIRSLVEAVATEAFDTALVHVAVDAEGDVLGVVRHEYPAGDDAAVVGATIDALAVAPAARRRGIGTALLREAERHVAMRGFDLFAAVESEHANLYDRLAYAAVAEMDDGRQLFRKSTLAPALEAAQAEETGLGVFCGWDESAAVQYYMDLRNRLHAVSAIDGTLKRTTTLVEFLAEAFGDLAPPRMAPEWTELKIQDRDFPIGFLLGYRYGLSKTLGFINLEHTFVPKGERVKTGPTDLAVEFADGTLVFNRYPLERSLIASGLLKYQTKRFNFADFDSPDTYFLLLQAAKVKTNYLKGIASFFDLFIDPITRDVLQRMGEPTNVRDLLLRATQMLATTEAKPASSMANHRLRGYERMPAVLYNEMSRAFAAYQAQTSAKRTFSINPEAVYQKILQDPCVQAVEDINPMHDIKHKTNVTYTGMGGRTAQSFVIADRQYPEDGVGVISECTPDSGKVAISTYLSADPVLKDARGLFDLASVDPKTIQPAQMLSATSLLMPGATQDDGKRANFISIQLTHHVPCKNARANRVRTGYEMVVAHRTGETFACAAQDDGTVLAVDDALKLVTIQYNAKPMPTQGKFDETLPFSALELRNAMLSKQPLFLIRPGSAERHYPLQTVLALTDEVNVRVAEILRFSRLEDVPGAERMKKNAFFDLSLKLKLGQEKEALYIRLELLPKMMPGQIDVFQFGTKHTPVSGSIVGQELKLNVKAGDAVAKGDIIAYNAGFFEPEPGTRQVNWMHGVDANVAFMETSITLEDSCMISRSLSQKLATTLGHTRPITIKANTVVHAMVNVGDFVQTTDHLCVLEDGDLNLLSVTDDPDAVEWLADMTRMAPKAKYHGHIVDVQVFYSCDLTTAHPSVQALVKRFTAPQHKLAVATRGTVKAEKFPEPGRLAVGAKYRGVAFEADTVAFFVSIAEEIPVEQGDKLCIMSANKTITGELMEKDITTVTGYPVDVLFAGQSVQNRIVTSPLLVGLTNRGLEAAEKIAVDKFWNP